MYFNILFFLLQRIRERLKREPERKKYKEDSKEWMDTTVNFYESRPWDLTVDNNTTTLWELMHFLIDSLRDRYAKFPPNLPADSSAQLVVSVE